MHLIYRKTCRVCGSSALTPVIDLGKQFLQGSFSKPGKELPPMRAIPTSLVRCDPTSDENACGLLQMAHSVPPQILYSSYWYRSGTNQTMRTHLKEIANEASLLINKEGARVLDIGCNDGTLLSFYPESYVKYGVDPSDVTPAADTNINLIQGFYPSEKLRHEIGSKRFEVISSIAMFYDLEDPVEFVTDIKNTLTQDGIWIFEMSYMPSMLELNSYDTICHEHLEYYSLAAIEAILKKAKMKLVRATLNEINGGSIRCYATHLDNFKYGSEVDSKNIASIRKTEFDLALDTDVPYRNFQDRVNRHKEQLTALLSKLKSEGKRIHVYGASTKGNTILQWCNIDRTIIDYAAERNPEKYGARTLGTDIQIISEAESRAMKPDYYLVLPWHFKREFLIREQEMIDQGVGLIFPLPTIEVINRQRLAS